MQKIKPEEQKHIFNDYKINYPSQNKLFTHQKVQSTGNIFFNDGFSRSRPSFTNRDQQKSHVTGQYLVNHESVQLNGHSNPLFSYRQHSQISQTIISIQQSNQLRHKDKSKIKSHSPLTPTKVLRLKKSLIKQKGSNYTGLNNHQSNLTHKNRQYSPSPSKLIISTHRKNHTAYNLPSNSDNNQQFNHLRNQLMEYFQLKMKDFTRKIDYQSEIIQALQKKIEENKKTINKNQQVIEELHKQLFITRYKDQLIVGNKQLNSNDYQYFINKIKDVQSKFNILQKIRLSEADIKQKTINDKIEIIQKNLVTLLNSKVTQLKCNLDKFILQKSQVLDRLDQSITSIDNKIIGRSHMLKQTLVELKVKVKSIQDTCTKDSFNHVQDDISEIPISCTNTFKVYKSNSNEEILKNEALNSLHKYQDSLNYSLTSYEQYSPKKILIRNETEHIYEMSDFETTKIIPQKTVDISKLTDDFYYPANNSTNNSFRNISPIISKQDLKFTRKTDKNENLDVSLMKNFIEPKGELQNAGQSVCSTNSKVDSQTMNKKIEVIKQLIEEKKKSITDQSILEGSLRCYIDKSGYLKYIDSKTFVFDNKGNLIQCSEGQFWVMVTKGLICGKGQQSLSM